VKRTRESQGAVQARRHKELSKIEQFRALSDDALKRKRERDWSPDALDLTTQLLAINPEFYTIWNYRRNILVKGIFPIMSPGEVNNLLSADLTLTMAALRQHPKVYWIWNHRRWCLEHVPDGPDEDNNGWRKANWAKELYVAEKMLDADARNFHAWHYRRYVLASMAVPYTHDRELAYTTRKIESNFSNFSAWHQRAKVYTSLWEHGLEEYNMGRVKDEEFELIKQALYTDPGDQSVWLYHRWLVGPGDNQALLEREIRVIEELLEIEPDSKWCLDSLVHYKSLLLRHTHSEQLVVDCINMLARLEELDAFRRKRYTEISEGITRNYRTASWNAKLGTFSTRV